MTDNIVYARLEDAVTYFCIMLFAFAAAWVVSLVIEDM